MQRYFAKEKINNYFLLNDDDLYHIKTVMRMNTNDKIEVVYEEKLYICLVDLQTMHFEIIKTEESNQANQNITLILPLLKEQKMDFVLQKATELGISEIIPIITERSVVKLDNKSFLKKKERWVKICKEASEQSKRLTIPIINDLKKIQDLKDMDGVKLLCSTTEKDKNIKFFLQTSHIYDKLLVAVGPEGGFTSKEEETFVQSGFNKVSLGKRIMRVETVPIFILSILNYEYME